MTQKVHANHLLLKNGHAHRISRSGFRGYVCLDGGVRPIQHVREFVAAGGGIAPSGAEVLPILQEVGREEPSWPGPGDALSELEAAVVQLRREIHELRDEKPTAPGESGDRDWITPRAWGFRHAGLCGWAARMKMVSNPRYARSPLLAEAIEMRDELQRLADASEPKTDYYRAPRS